MAPLSRRRLLALAAGLLVARRSSGGQTMQSRPIHSSGEQLPVIGLGTWQTFDVGSAPAELKPLEEVLSAFFRAGGRVLDSSPMYGRSEAVAGSVAKKSGINEKLFVATKVWTSGKEAGIAQMERSIRLLQKPKLDLMQVHNLVDVETHLATLREWKRAGRIRYIGITHYHAGAYAEVERVLSRNQVDFLQINYSLQEREAEKRLIPFARERGIAVIVNRPYGGGSLFGSVRGKALPSWAAEIDCRSWGQLFLKWILGNEAVTCVIPATAKVKHVEDNLAAGFGRMPDAAMRKKIAALSF